MFTNQTAPLVDFYRDRPTFSLDQRAAGAGPGDRGSDSAPSSAALAAATSDARPGTRMIICKSPSELERMKAANALVADVLADAARGGAPGRDDGASWTRWPNRAMRAGGRRAGVQGLSRVPGDDLRVGERRGDARDPVAAGAGRRRHRLDRPRRACSTGSTATRRSRVPVGRVSERAAELLRGDRGVAAPGDRAGEGRRADLGPRARRAGARRARTGSASSGSSSATGSGASCTRSRRSPTTGRRDAGRGWPRAWCWRSSPW